jgi:hypothetical protein
MSGVGGRRQKDTRKPQVCPQPMLESEPEPEGRHHPPSNRHRGLTGCRNRAEARAVGGNGVSLAAMESVPQKVKTELLNGRVPWLTPVIPAIQEAQNRGSRFKANLGK